MQHRRSTVADSRGGAKIRPTVKPSSTKGIGALSGASLVEREKILEEMIKDLKKENTSLKAQVKALEDKPLPQPPKISLEDDFEKLEELGEERKNLEKEIVAVENRIRHMQAENYEAEKEIAEYDVKTRKVLEARQKKIEWEKQRMEELEKAKDANMRRRMELLEAAKLRDQVISQRRDVNSKQTKKLMEDIEADREVRDKLKARVSEYEEMLAEHRRLKTLKENKENKQDHVFEENQKKKEQKVQLEQRIKDEAHRLSDMDRRLDRLRILEQQMMEEKKQTLTHKGIIKSQFEDILNRKLDEKEIKDILGRDKVGRNTLHRSGSMTKMLEVIEERKGMKSPLAKSRIVGLQNSNCSHKLDSSRQSINKSTISATGMKKPPVDTGRSVDKKFAKPTSSKINSQASKPVPSSPMPLKEKGTLKSGQSTPNITPASANRKGLKDGQITPSKIKSSKFSLGSAATKKPPTSKTTADDIPLSARSNTGKSQVSSTQDIKAEIKPEASEKENIKQPDELKKSEIEVKDIQSRVEKIIEDTEVAPPPPEDSKITIETLPESPIIQPVTEERPKEVQIAAVSEPAIDNLKVDDVNLDEMQEVKEPVKEPETAPVDILQEEPKIAQEEKPAEEISKVLSPQNETLDLLVESEEDIDINNIKTPDNKDSILEANSKLESAPLEEKNEVAPQPTITEDETTKKEEIEENTTLAHEPSQVNESELLMDDDDEVAGAELDVNRVESRRQSKGN